MRFRRFTARSPQAALRQVKETLGDDALILATSARPDGGVEITAAVDVERVTAAIPSTAEGSLVEPGLDRGAALGLQGNGPRSQTDEGDMEMIKRELHDLSLRIRSIDRALHPVLLGNERLASEARELAERLALAGLSSELAVPVATSFDEERRNGATLDAALETSLARHLVATPDEPRRRVTAFVGPTGGGKTTTIAKLAAAEVAAGAGKLGLIMADTYRVGAAEQLGAYARIFGVPMRLARDAGELKTALQAFAEKDEIYVDTAGLSGDEASFAEVARLIEAAGDVAEVTAVVSATTSRVSLRKAWRQIARLLPASCVITKLDEGGELGTACSWLAEVGAPIRWLGIGQRVPDDFTSASGRALARWLLAA